MQCLKSSKLAVCCSFRLTPWWPIISLVIYQLKLAQTGIQFKLALKHYITNCILPWIRIYTSLQQNGYLCRLLQYCIMQLHKKLNIIRVECSSQSSSPDQWLQTPLKKGSQDVLQSHTSQKCSLMAGLINTVCRSTNNWTNLLYQQLAIVCSARGWLLSVKSVLPRINNLGLFSDLQQQQLNCLSMYKLCFIDSNSRLKQTSQNLRMYKSRTRTLHTNALAHALLHP